MADEKNDVQNVPSQGAEKDDVKNNLSEGASVTGQANVKSQKTESEFLGGLTRKDATKISPDKTGMYKVEGSFPQIIRKPLKDKTVNGLMRTTY